MAPKFYYVTEYALSKGIVKYPARSVKVIEGKYLSKQPFTWIAKTFWHESLKEANDHAKELAKKKLASLAKQKIKLNTIIGGAIRITKFEE